VGALGKFPGKPRFKEELISAASHGAGREAYDALQQAIAATSNDDRPVKVVAGEAVYFYLGKAGSFEWTPLTFDGERYRLALSAGLGVEPLVDE